MFSPAQCARILSKPGHLRTPADVTLLAGTVSRFHVFATLPRDVLHKLCKFLHTHKYKRGELSTFLPSQGCVGSCSQSRVCACVRGCCAAVRRQGDDLHPCFSMILSGEVAVHMEPTHATSDADLSGIGTMVAIDENGGEDSDSDEGHHRTASKAAMRARPKPVVRAPL